VAQRLCNGTVERRIYVAETAEQPLLSKNSVSGSWEGGVSSVQKVVAIIFSRLAQLTCSHKWVRARFDDGSYGLRCQLCMKHYRHTWDGLMAQPVPKPVVRESKQHPEGVWASPVLVLEHSEQ
jgi:hypothetical protein